MQVERSIRDKLAAAFSPARLGVENESSKHAGHAGMADHPDAGGETHFKVVVVSDRFDGLSRIERHRQINAVLEAELAGPVHALAIQALTPAEAPV